MPTCELCGKRLGTKAYLIKVDRVEYLACEKCASKYGKVIKILQFKEKERNTIKEPTRRRISRPSYELEVVEDYPDIVKRAREELGYTRELLARLVGEKESTIRRIEDGSLIPSIDLARKLEKVLKVKLVEEVEGEELPERRRDVELTLGDIVHFKEG